MNSYLTGVDVIAGLLIINEKSSLECTVIFGFSSWLGTELVNKFSFLEGEVTAVACVAVWVFAFGVSVELYEIKEEKSM